MTKGTNDIRTLLNEIEQLKRDLDDAVTGLRKLADFFVEPSPHLRTPSALYDALQILAKHPAPEVKE